LNPAKARLRNSVFLMGEFSVKGFLPKGFSNDGMPLKSSFIEPLNGFQGYGLPGCFVYFRRNEGPWEAEVVEVRLSPNQMASIPR